MTKFDEFSDNDLRAVLRRREPPDGFAERTLATIARSSSAATRARVTPTPSALWAGLALAASIVIAIGGLEFRAHQRDAQARKAAEELTLAMRITSDTLREVQNKLAK